MSSLSGDDFLKPEDYLDDLWIRNIIEWYERRENQMNEGETKLFDSELKVMDVLWREGDVPAKHIADILTGEVGWNKNTTYTLIKRCIKKGAIERTEPGFLCHALIAKEQVQEAETNELIDKIYDGSADKLFAALLGRKKLSDEQIEQLKQIVGEFE